MTKPRAKAPFKSYVVIHSHGIEQFDSCIEAVRAAREQAPATVWWGRDLKEVDFRPIEGAIHVLLREDARPLWVTVEAQDG